VTPELQVQLYNKYPKIFADKDKSETFNGVKSYKESTQRLIEANQGL